MVMIKQAKKYFGQHFLINKLISQKIVDGLGVLNSLTLPTYIDKSYGVPRDIYFPGSIGIDNIFLLSFII